MFKPDFTKTANGSVAKLNMLNTNPLGYVMLSVLAGAFIGVGVLLGRHLRAGQARREDHRPRHRHHAAHLRHPHPHMVHRGRIRRSLRMGQPHTHGRVLPCRVGHLLGRVVGALLQGPFARSAQQGGTAR